MSVNYSSFWDSNSDTVSVDEFLGLDVEKKKGKDPIELAAYKRAISNFVNILTGESIPVKFEIPSKSNIKIFDLKKNIEIINELIKIIKKYKN